jgi:hypothetical protein
MSDSPTPSPDLAAAVQLAREAKAQPPPATADAPQHPANLISLADAVDIVMDRVFVERSEMADAILRLPRALPTSRAPASPRAMTMDERCDAIQNVMMANLGAAAHPAEPPPPAEVTDLHSLAMNTPHSHEKATSFNPKTDALPHVYACGHRDARHAIAEALLPVQG